MNLYSRKLRWKMLLMIIALVIVGITLWYSNFIAKKIRNEERNKVELWTQAIEKRASLVVYTQQLFEELKIEENKKVDLWADAQTIISTQDLDDYTFFLKVTQNNTTIPMLVLNDDGTVNSYRNLKESMISTAAKVEALRAEMEQNNTPIDIHFAKNKSLRLYYNNSKLFRELQTTLDDLINSFISETVINAASVPVILTDSAKTQVLKHGNISEEIINSPDLLKEKIQLMSLENTPIEVNLGSGQKRYVFYENSMVIKQLEFFPFVQLMLIGGFLLIAYLLFSTFRKAEQDQVWIGLAKETAHQLGTPLSSLMAWMSLLEAQGVDKSTLVELNKDVSRLEVITNRFSKIGSKPDLEKTSVCAALKDTLDYLKPRVSSKVKIEVFESDENILAQINIPLFSWVIENLTKNAIDAMEGEGELSFEVLDDIQSVYIDVTDTGKGISKSNFKTVFEPGFTTKKRGWGLGLSLTKRIMESYHKGKIFVKRSEPNIGTTFRIVLKR